MYQQQVSLLPAPKLNRHRHRKPKLDGIIRCKSMPFVIQFDLCCVMLLVFLLRAEYRVDSHREELTRRPLADDPAHLSLSSSLITPCCLGYQS